MDAGADAFFTFREKKGRIAICLCSSIWIEQVRPKDKVEGSTPSRGAPIACVGEACYKDLDSLGR